jgi:regulator of replication initiation timing
MIYKCKLAMEKTPECGKDICCYWCPDFDGCGYACLDGQDEERCPDIVEEETGLEQIQKVLPYNMDDVTDLMVRLKETEAKIADIKESLLKAMEEHNIKKFENDRISVSYVAPTTRKTFDKKALQKDHPDIDLEQYNKVSNVKSSVRIQVK